MSSLGLHLIRLARLSIFSVVSPGLPERWMLKREPALRRWLPISCIINEVRPVHVKSKCNSYLFRLIASPNIVTISSCYFSVNKLSHRVFHPKLIFYNLRFWVIISKILCIYFGNNEFQLISREINRLDFSIICSKWGIELSFRLTLTKLKCKS